MSIQSALPSLTKQLAFVLCAFLALPNSALSAKSAGSVSLSPVWRMESDEDYSYQANYQPPGPVKGLALHGYFADDRLNVSDAKVSLPASAECRESVTLPDPRSLPDYLPARTHTEFWFYRSGDQGLYLGRTWRVERSDQCDVKAKVETRIIHMSLFNGMARFIVIHNGAAPVVSTNNIAEGELYPIPAHFVVMDRQLLQEGPRAAVSRRTDDRLENTSFRRTCFDTSFAFFFSNSCVLNETGPWQGLLISADSEADDGTSYSEYRLLDLDPEARIDGRLFQWDRKIVLAPTAGK
ncbi:hypothetical protein EWH08_15990 [Sphingobium indicum]|uniref:Uncharacterized protein n=2 Tax=Sphingobium indicum TaxID=332055 RepID=A0A4Q4J021_9SPHN|nr:hypothetical protein [Sphingobium indicum]NYI24199.1 hypothetical protein [Sphingobium indicum]RYL99090.1 hypothetical protein EWH08_15990 [Sphingobium indicum]